jgi:hypothetical protein
MKTFVSFNESLEQLITTIIASNDLHAKWLNTLSYLENCGARKIAACEHPTLVKEEMLKHAAEEFRHAHHLKRQIEKLDSCAMETYSPHLLLGGVSSLHYLRGLDMQTCRYLKKRGLEKNAITEAAYLLVTYAIEKRADELYRVYDQALRAVKSKIAVKSILLEEKEHLAEMIEGLHRLPLGFEYAEQVCAFEGELCRKWISAIRSRV